MSEKEGRDWVDDENVNGKRNDGKVKNVKEGNEYELRVVEVKKEGNSEKSDKYKYVVDKNRFLDKYIDRKNIKKKVVRSGKLLSIEDDVKGEKKKNVKWELKDVVIK
jgi:hypothetical protein